MALGNTPDYHHPHLCICFAFCMESSQSIKQCLDRAEEPCYNTDLVVPICCLPQQQGFTHITAVHFTSVKRSPRGSDTNLLNPESWVCSIVTWGDTSGSHLCILLLCFRSLSSNAQSQPPLAPVISDSWVARRSVSWLHPWSHLP